MPSSMIETVAPVALGRFAHGTERNGRSLGDDGFGVRKYRRRLEQLAIQHHRRSIVRTGQRLAVEQGEDLGEHPSGRLAGRAQDGAGLAHCVQGAKQAIGLGLDGRAQFTQRLFLPALL